MISTPSWLPDEGSLPRNWKIVPLKYLTTLFNGYPFRSDTWMDSGTPILRIENLNGSTNFNYSTLSLSERYQVRQGDLLFSWSGNPGTSFGPFIWKRPGLHYLNQHIYKLSVHECDNDWLYWSLKAATHWIERELTSGMIGMVHVTKDELGNVPIPIPPLDEQRRIAQFLNGEVSRIDRLIACQLRTLRLLEERINSQILKIIEGSSLVTTSGTATVPLRRLLKKLRRTTMPTDEVVTAFRDGQVTSRSTRRPDGYTLTADTAPQGQGVQVGDVVIHGLDGFAGAIGDAEAAGNCSPVYHVCRPIDNGNSAFYGRLLRVLAVDNYLGLFATSTRERAVDFRSWGLFGNIPIPRVDPALQHQIGRTIFGIRPLRGEVSRFNERLAERRQALITAAVTGQIDVTIGRGLPTAEGVAV